MGGAPQRPTALLEAALQATPALQALLLGELRQLALLLEYHGGDASAVYAEGASRVAGPLPHPGPGADSATFFRALFYAVVLAGDPCDFCAAPREADSRPAGDGAAGQGGAPLAAAGAADFLTEATVAAEVFDEAPATHLGEPFRAEQAALWRKSGVTSFWLPDAGANNAFARPSAAPVPHACSASPPAATRVPLSAPPPGREPTFAQWPSGLIFDDLAEDCHMPLSALRGRRKRPADGAAEWGPRAVQRRRGRGTGAAEAAAAGTTPPAPAAALPPPLTAPPPAPAAPPALSSTSPVAAELRGEFSAVSTGAADASAAAPAAAPAGAPAAAGATSDAWLAARVRTALLAGLRQLRADFAAAAPGRPPPAAVARGLSQEIAALRRKPRLPRVRLRPCAACGRKFTLLSPEGGGGNPAGGATDPLAVFRSYMRAVTEGGEACVPLHCGGAAVDAALYDSVVAPRCREYSAAVSAAKTEFRSRIAFLTGSEFARLLYDELWPPDAVLEARGDSLDALRRSLAYCLRPLHWRLTRADDLREVRRLQNRVVRLLQTALRCLAHPDIAVARRYVAEVFFGRFGWNDATLARAYLSCMHEVLHRKVECGGAFRQRAFLANSQADQRRVHRAFEITLLGATAQPGDELAAESSVRPKAVAGAAAAAADMGLGLRLQPGEAGAEHSPAVCDFNILDDLRAALAT